jgi:hypothetical protein
MISVPGRVRDSASNPAKSSVWRHMSPPNSWPKDMMVNPAGAAAIDIGSTMHMAAINPNADNNPVRAFGTFTGGLHAMACWFKDCGVTSVAMESTGVLDDSRTILHRDTANATKGTDKSAG